MLAFTAASAAGEASSHSAYPPPAALSGVGVGVGVGSAVGSTTGGSSAASPSAPPGVAHPLIVRTAAAQSPAQATVIRGALMPRR
ncbi:hypothetical protein BC477_08825 [Clavibacter michiganensis subsp. michiganensis]|uniref:Uncharacterized protein n=1 Tax=Clavibacter michiganensis subsp. michiganensis TaxID=33013 RepID=A0A251XP52_CLAMM|nr:hypothetical protein BC477_08825 [Clavibacter michiganensis subsp. michiganensis]OUE04828.1 hypothetical protein CMMCAS07_07755 [Clavibacter michiganensis subsp. michiganensis]